MTLNALFLMFVAAVLGVGGAALAAPPAASSAIASIDLSQPFRTRSPWRFTATQGPPAADPLGMDGETAPGAIVLCLSASGGASCDPSLQRSLRTGVADDVFAEPHFLADARVVRLRGPVERSLLLVQAASLHSGDGDQVVRTQVLAYDRAADRFVRVYDFATGRNNNQDVRLVEAGPLSGAIITAEPTANAPYGYWITVNRPAAGRTYAKVLRYRSATTYGDGNPLSVVDSEMPNIQRRLGLWRPGSPLPLPDRPCPNPRLRGMELWCN